MDGQERILNIDRIRARGEKLTIGSDLRYVREVDSTNRIARELPAGTWRTGTVIMTDYQADGRGRAGRSWTAPRGSSLLLSVLLGRDRVDRPSDAVMAAALAVGDAITEETGLRNELKWPNDVLVGGRKVCGILAESVTGSQGRIVVGIGLNVNFDPAEHADVPETATSLQRELGRAMDREALAIALLRSLDLWYGCLIADAEMVFGTWSSRLDVLGNRLLVSDAAGTWWGMATAVQRDGGLVIRDDHGKTRTVYAADVSIRRPEGFTSRR